MSWLVSLSTGAVAGFVAAFGAKFAWGWITKPVLEFDSGIVREGESHFEEPMAWAKYKVEITNSGGSVASNCKARVILEGSRETVEERPDAGPNGEFTTYEASVEKKYKIELIPRWNEAESPTRIDLNREEFARFDLFSVHSEAALPDGDDTNIIFGVRNEDYSSEEDEFWETKPIRVETIGPRANPEPLVDTKARLDRYVFEEIEWETCEVSITSADADKIASELRIEFDGVIPDVDLSEKSGSSEIVKRISSIRDWF